MTHVRYYGGGEYGIEGRYDERVRRICKGAGDFQAGLFTVQPTPGMRWNSEARAWTGYLDAVQTAVARLQAECNMRVDGTDELRQHDADNAVEPVKARDIRKYQAIGANFLLTRGAEGCILADEMGLGKTLQALRAMRALRFQGRSIVVCLNRVKGTWRDEAAKWWPEAELVMLEGTKPDKRLDLVAKLLANSPKPGGQLVIIHYDILHAWAKELAECNAVFLAFDEAQYLQSEKSRRSKAAKLVARAVPRRAALTGTPPVDKPKDLWNLVDTISEGRMGNFFYYALRYCDAHKEQVTRDKAVWLFDGSSNLPELKKRLSTFTLQRSQKDVALELPELTRSIIPVEVQRGHRAPMLGAVKSEKAMRRALDLAADGKVPEVIELTREQLNAGKRVVVFTHRRLVAEAIAKAFLGSANFMHGGMNQAARDKVLKAKPTLLVATLDTAGVGLNDLVSYDTAIFAELHWVPSVLAQAEKRLHRFGQAASCVRVLYVIAEGTADELIREGCIKKLRVRLDTLGKLDDGLLEELDADVKRSGVASLQALAESLVA